MSYAFSSGVYSSLMWASRHHTYQYIQIFQEFNNLKFGSHILIITDHFLKILCGLYLFGYPYNTFCKGRGNEYTKWVKNNLFLCTSTPEFFTYHWILRFLFAQFCESFEESWVHCSGKIVPGNHTCWHWFYNTCTKHKYLKSQNPIDIATVLTRQSHSIIPAGTDPLQYLHRTQTWPLKSPLH